MLDYLKSRGCRLGGVTLGERGLIWYDHTGAVRTLPTLAVPSDRILETSGAGDVFHGAYVYSYLTNPSQTWEQHFRFAQAAAAYKIQRLGNEAGLPTLADIAAIKRELEAQPRSAGRAASIELADRRHRVSVRIRLTARAQCQRQSNLRAQRRRRLGGTYP
jgi:bifunctional ADP-heptose synthase (sugar kinase/adenylyltransferase)